MRIVSAETAQALAGTHEVSARIDVRDVITGDILIADIPIDSGQLDGTLLNDDRWALRFATGDPTVIPTGAGSPLSGLALTQAELTYTVRPAGSGPAESVLLARLLIDGSEISRDPDSGGALITVSCVSPSRWIADAGILDAIQPTPGELSANLVTAIARELLPYEIPVSWEIDPLATVPASLTGSGSPWRVIADIADAAGGVAFTDALGRLRVTAPATVGGDALGLRTDSTIVGTSAGVGRPLLYNRVRVTFTDPELGDVLGDAVINSGPLAWGGPAGRRLYEESRPGPVSQGEANAYAGSLLTSAGYGVRPSYVETAPDPRIEPGDNVLITYASGAVERSLVTSVSFPLETGQSCTLGVRGSG